MFRVPKHRAFVKLCGMDGSVTRGALFVDPASPRHGGQQTILERLNGPEAFIVLEVGEGGQIEIFQKRHLLRVTPAGDMPMDCVFVPDGLITRQEDVHLTLTNGSTMHGRIWMGLPHDRSRLSDFLNMGEEFFPLLIPGGIHLVRTDSVVKAVPLAAAPTGEEVTKDDMIAIQHTFRESFEHAGGTVRPGIPRT
jgi:hypothetical protein